MRHVRRTCAKLCRAGGGELEQIQLLLGHASIQTIERYLGTKQDLVHAPNDGIKPRVAVQTVLSRRHSGDSPSLTSLNTQVSFGRVCQPRAALDHPLVSLWLPGVVRFKAVILLELLVRVTRIPPALPQRSV